MAAVSPSPHSDSPWAHVQAPGREIVRATLWHLVMPHAVGLVLGTWLGAWSLSSALAAGSAGIAFTIGLWVAWPRWSARGFTWLVGLGLVPLDGAVWLLETGTGGFDLPECLWILLVWAWGVPRARRLALASLLRGRIVSGPLWPWDGWRIPDDLWRARAVPAGVWASSLAAAQAVDLVALPEADTYPAMLEARALLGLPLEGELEPSVIRDARDRLVGALATLKPPLKAAERARRVRELGLAREALLAAPAERVVAKVPRSAMEPRDLVLRLERLADSTGNVRLRRQALQLASFAWPSRLQGVMRRNPEAVRDASKEMDARWMSAWFPYGWSGLMNWGRAVTGVFVGGWPLLWVASLSRASDQGLQAVLCLGIGVWGVLRLALGGAAVSEARARLKVPVKAPATEGPAPVPHTPGKRAPDDRGPLDRHHDYVVTKDGVASTFVWIPVFQAYQLIRPDRCGYPDQAVGVWVAHPPTSGARDVDWAVETFGGFYAGKFQASRADAVPGHTETGSGATAGASSTLKVARYCVPWTNVTWDQARTACAAYDAHCHLMADDEWTALAVWSMIHGVTVHGNNSSGKDSRDTAVTFLIDPTCGGRALTGTGKKSGWLGQVNLTTHTAATDGVYDLNGNVMEWTATLGGAKGANRYVVNDMETGVSMPRSGRISTLSTDTRLRRYGVPGSTGTAGRAFGRNYFGSNDRLFTVSMRGGRWYDVSDAGVWTFSLYYSRSSSSALVGFRPVLRF